MPDTSNETYRTLRIIHLFLGVLHLAQGVLTLLFSDQLLVTVTTAFLKFNQTTGEVAPFINELVTIPLPYIASAVVLIAGMYHLAIASPFFFKNYITNLEQRFNPYRWVEYSITASLIVSVVGILSGIFDIFLQLSLFMLTAGMMMYAYIFELLNQRRQYGEPVNWVPFIVGSSLGIVPWVIITTYYFAGLQTVGELGGFWNSIIFFTFMIYALSMINMMLTIVNRGPWKDYVFSDKIFLLLSVTSKTALLWQIFFGVLF
jgi:hypothetical protein